MKLHRAWPLGILFIAASSWLVLPLAGQEAPLTTAEKALADQINKVRLDNGKPPIEVTQSLTKVARLHVGDLNANHPDTGDDSRGEECNLHSWSNQGAWQPVCYTDDHLYQNLMWSKPAELTSYTAKGYEIASFYSSGMTPEQAVASWKGSPDHLAVIVETGIWAAQSWKAMGIAVSGSYACVWFGEIVDPAGPIATSAAQPTTAQDYPDVRAYAGGLALSILDMTIAGTEPLKLVLGLNGRDTADLTECRYTVQKKSGGTWQRVFRSHKSFFADRTLVPGQTKPWHWDRRVDEGQSAPGPGKYRIRFKAPRFTSDIIYREFEILR
jgi:hypothetical protein